MSEHNPHPLVTVMVPTYNRASYLKETIDSVLKQKFTDFELLIIDNCSTDDTQKVVGLYSDARIRYTCNDSNIGIIGNYNQGLKLSRGKYIYLLSDDDLMSDVRNLSLKVDVLRQHPNVSVVYSSFETINESGEIIGGNWAETNPSWPAVIASPVMKGEEAFKELYYGWNFICMHTVLVRREILTKHNIQFSNQLRYLLDYALWLRLSLISDIYYIDVPLVHYRVHKSNTTKIITTENYAVELLSIKGGLASLYYDNLSLVPQALKEINDSINTQLGIDGRSWAFKQLKRVKMFLKRVLLVIK